MLYFWKKFFPKRKLLNCYVSKNIDLNQIQKDGLVLDVSSDGDQLLNPKIVSFKFTNLGQVMIDALDWESPMKFVFDESCPILNCYVSEKSNENIICNINANGKEIVVSFGTLHSKDSVTVDVLIDSKILVYKEYYRIKGINEIEHRETIIYTKDVFKAIFKGFGNLLMGIVGIGLIVLIIYLIGKAFSLIGSFIPENIKTWIGAIFGLLFLLAIIVGIINGVYQYIIENAKRKI